jgi:hypothetical protein
MSFGCKLSPSQCHLSLHFYPPKQELCGSNVPLLVGIVALKPLFLLLIDSSPLSFTLTFCSQTTLCMLGLAELDTNCVLSCFLNTILPLNSYVLGLNQTSCGSTNLSITIFR